jgi:hypothetical protein
MAADSVNQVADESNVQYCSILMNISSWKKRNPHRVEHGAAELLSASADCCNKRAAYLMIRLASGHLNIRFALLSSKVVHLICRYRTVRVDFGL